MESFSGEMSVCTACGAIVAREMREKHLDFHIGLSQLVDLIEKHVPRTEEEPQWNR